MSDDGSRAFAAAFRSIGVNALVTPPSDMQTLELGAKYTSGDECYPEKVTLGDFLRIADQPGFDPSRTAFFMPTAGGPCRFGQYSPFLQKVLKDRGLEEAIVVSPSSGDGYAAIGEHAGELTRIAWRALVAADILRKLLLTTRPYEVDVGETDAVHEECLVDVCEAIERRGLENKDKLALIRRAIERSREKFEAVHTDYSEVRPLIGVVGEIFCRLSTFSNDDLIRRIEEHGGEGWLSDVAEWIWYTNAEQRKNLKLEGKRFSKAMLGTHIKAHFQRKDEETLLEPVADYFRGYEEPHDIMEILNLSFPYLPYHGALGEMVLSVGKAIYLQEKGADGIVDISPFTCMNGIVCEAVYPRVSSEHDSIPIRNFYFDGTLSDLDRDIGIFMELAHNYRRRKKAKRKLPARFGKKSA
jgi:predicted nucleotide-binding protein (sugar kinase/HSP70/actin superfamily)